MSADNHTQPRLATRVFWSVGSVASGATFNAMALFALFYMTTVLGISPALAGSLIFFTKLYDAVTDPLMGAISDRTRHRWGPRRPYIALGAVTLGVSFALFFNLPSLSGGAMVATVVGALLLYSTCYTIFAVPYLAMPPTIAPTYDSRSQLMSFRLAFLIFGVLIGSVLGPKIVEWGGDGADGYSLLGIVMGLVAAVAGLIAFFGTQDVVEMPAQNRSSGQAKGAQLRQGLRDFSSVFGYAPFRLLTLVKLLQLAVLAVALACTPYFFRFVLERSTGDITYYLMTFSLVGLASIPVWRMIVARFGKRDVYIVSIGLYGLGMASWWLWQPGESDVYFYARAALIGAFSNGTLLCALSLLPDTMEYDQLKSGQNRSGMMSGVFTTVEKIAGALGPLLIGVLLETSGLVKGATEQPESALTAIKFGLSIVPAVLCFAAIPLLYAYRLGPTELSELRENRELAGSTR